MWMVTSTRPAPRALPFAGVLLGSGSKGSCLVLGSDCQIPGYGEGVGDRQHSDVD